jgi:hypothetical protein
MINSLDSIIVRFCRWSLNVPKFSNKLHTLRENGMRPFVYSYRAARANYYLMLQSRPSDHLTTAALLHVLNAKKSLMHRKWLCPILTDLKKWSLFFCDGLPSVSSFSCSFPHKKVVYSRLIRAYCDADWCDELCALVQVKLHDRLFEVEDFASFSTVEGRAHNVIHAPNNLTFPLMISLNGPLCRKAAPFGYVCLLPRLSRALALFRLGAAPLKRNTCFTSCLSSRICSFCYNTGAGKCIEDEFHVCFECKLFNVIRCSLFKILHQNNFKFSSKVVKRSLSDFCPLALLAELLSVSNPTHVRCVSRFLNDCLSLRAMYLEKYCMHAGREPFNYWPLFDSDRQKLSKIFEVSVSIATHVSKPDLPDCDSDSIHLFSKLFSIFITPRVPLWLFVHELNQSNGN